MRNTETTTPVTSIAVPKSLFDEIDHTSLQLTALLGILEKGMDDTYRDVTLLLKPIASRLAEACDRVQQIEEAGQ